MFAHQVIEDLKDWNPPGVDNTSRDTISLLNNAQKFNFGTVDSVYSMFEGKKLLMVPNRTFMDDLGYDINLPYPICWFDMVSKNKEGHCFKEGMLLEDAPKGFKGEVEILSEIDNEMHIIKIDRPKGFFVHVFGTIENNKWLISPWSFYVSPNNIQKNIVGTESVFEPMLAYNAGSPQFTQANFKASHEALSILNLCLLTLNCKNIGTETTPAPVKLNNKRKKKGKLPIFSYKTLVLKPFGKKQEALAEKGLWNNRIHLAMGHWRTYTKDRPMFGKYPGRFWIPAHVRGRNRDGVVMKDYKVEA